ncbi:hypothetical protein EIP91_006428 [Steccherinum ochraceum]|uniref:Uncharacterized protein n=1 Tax=Steccherinum ochraceum TaxID=92696 RepID=A0A4R0R873_9APHY|nr:hypothetical protein EIP91_006428 [Steccherinum ochraceum]
MDDMSPNLRMNTPGLGAISSPTSTSTLPSSTPSNDANMNDPAIPSSVVDRTNVIVALSILAAVGVCCIVASVLLTSHARGFVVARIPGRGGGGEPGGVVYHSAWEGNEEGRYERKRVGGRRVPPRLWDVVVESERLEKEGEEERTDHERWKEVQPLSSQLVHRSSQTHPPSSKSLRRNRVRVSVVIAMPVPPRPPHDDADDETERADNKCDLPISEYAIGTADLSVARTKRKLVDEDEEFLRKYRYK